MGKNVEKKILTNSASGQCNKLGTSNTYEQLIQMKALKRGFPQGLHSQLQVYWRQGQTDLFHRHIHFLYVCESGNLIAE